MRTLLSVTVAAMAMLGVAATDTLALDLSRGNKLTVYMAKFVCGDGQFSREAEGGVLNGVYATAINIGNPNNETITITKEVVATEVVLVNLLDDLLDQTPNGPSALTFDSDQLPPLWAVEWDCGELVDLEILETVVGPGFIKGFLIIKVDAVATRLARAVDVVAVYTSQQKDEPADQLVSIDVEQISGHKVRGELEINNFQ